MFQRTKRPSLALDLAPLIDVVFLLLVFFMLTSSFIPPSLPLELPKADNTNPPPSSPITVSLDREGRVAINGETVALADFGRRLKEILATSDSTTVAFRGDREAPYGHFVELMDQIRQAGAGQLQIVHQAP